MMEETLNPEGRLKKLQSYISKMPSLSTTVSKVLEICNDPSSSAHDLNRVISLDPVLTGQVLKLINSAYYGVPKRVTSLTKAIIMLGINTVKNLVLATSVLASFKGSKTGGTFSIDDYWVHCLFVGTTSKIIAGLCGIPKNEREEFFVAGLLHDLGKLPMIACFGDLYDEAVEKSDREDAPLYQTEKDIMGLNHCQVGLLIGAKWKLSNEMRNAIVYHHTPFAEGSLPDQLLYAMSLANQLTYHFRIGHAGDTFGDALLTRDLASHLGISVEEISGMREQIEQEIDKAKIFLQGAKKG